MSSLHEQNTVCVECWRLALSMSAYYVGSSKFCSKSDLAEVFVFFFSVCRWFLILTFHCPLITNIQKQQSWVVLAQLLNLYYCQLLLHALTVHMYLPCALPHLIMKGYTYISIITSLDMTSGIFIFSLFKVTYPFLWILYLV